MIGIAPRKLKKVENAIFGIVNAAAKNGAMNAYPGRVHSPVITYCRFNMYSSHLEPILNRSSRQFLIYKKPSKNCIKPDSKYMQYFFNFLKTPVIYSYNTRFKKRGSAKWKKNRGIKGKKILCFFWIIGKINIFYLGAFYINIF